MRSSSRASRARTSPTTELAEVYAPDVVLDMCARVFNPKVYGGYEGLREYPR